VAAEGLPGRDGARHAGASEAAAAARARAAAAVARQALPSV